MADLRWLWDSRSLRAQALRQALLPLSGVFRASVAVRNTLYDRGWLSARALGAPSVSVGNLTVGGTGKTPVANWIAGELRARGARPAILLRGYGEDEVLVHRFLLPDGIVVADADRVRGAATALSQGADVLVLDDAFQHRRAKRDADIVLVSADTARRPEWPLPVGPWREPFSALRRATLTLVTCKGVSNAAGELMASRVLSATGPMPLAMVRIDALALVPWGGAAPTALGVDQGGRTVAVSAIADPLAFEAQLRAAGIEATPERYADHHRYTPEDVTALLRRAGDVKRVICTLKDAVKLGPLWPHEGPPLWYLSQRITVERGAELITRLLVSLLDARPAARPHVSRPTN